MNKKSSSSLKSTPSVDPQVDPNIDMETEERDDAIIGYALRWSLIVIGVLAVIGAGAAYWLTRPPAPIPVKQTKLREVRTRDVSAVEIPTVRFVDITDQAGIDFVHENGAAGEKLLPETMGGGCAFFDYDNDGDQDLLFVNSQRWPWDTRPKPKNPATLVLYRNDGKGNFANVTAGSGLDVSLYGMGAAVGDYDNDSRVDVFITAVGKNRLFHNEGDGKFTDVTENANIAGDAHEWSTSAGWFDYDNDGDLDLFVCNYVKWSRKYDVSQNFQLVGGGRAYGRPQNFEGTFPYLYRNEGATGEGGVKFTDVSAEAGVQIRNPVRDVPLAKSLAVTFTDFDADGWLDVIVANDTVQNLLFRNRGNGSFEEMGVTAGVAFDDDGKARGAMGIDTSYFRNDDALGVAIGNFATEMTALYVSYNNEMLFTDQAISTGLGPNTRQELTFGVFYLDYDLDGRLDLFTSNGHLEEDINRVQASQHYEQSPQLFWNCGREHDTEFAPVSAEKCGEDFVRPMVGRGAAYADIDSDGDLDLLITAVGKPPRLLRNDQNLGNHWVRFQLIGDKCNRDAIGAQVEVHLKDHILRRHVTPTRSYLSQVELPVTFGLGAEKTIKKVHIRWPDGSTQELRDVQVDQLHVVGQGMASSN